MFTDIKGQTRQKVGLHNHTTVSDGKKTPEEVFEIYRGAGYDAMALTDHWKWQPGGSTGGMTLLSGAEYNVGGNDCSGFVCGRGVYHITAIGCERDPLLVPSPDLTPEMIAARIHEAGGLAVLAHPAWSLNDPSVVAGMDCFDATEIYNAVSGVHHSDRPDSSCFCDLLACRGRFFPLIAADDAHYYDDDAAAAFVCVRADGNDRASIMAALKRGDFYASQGPQLLTEMKDGVLCIDCTPCASVSVFSDLAWVGGRIERGTGLTRKEYPVHPGEHFLRVCVTDGDGRRAWSSYYQINQ